MNINTKRQLKDIQFRGEQLIKGKPSLVDIKEFDQYNEELKEFLLNDIQDSEVIERIKKIPKIFQESINKKISRNIFALIMGSFSSGLFVYFHNKRKIDNAKVNIRDAMSKYSSIEFLVKNY